MEYHGIFFSKKQNKVTVSWKFGHCYFLHDFFDVLCGNYQLLIILEKKKIPIKKKQVVSNCFIKPLISSAFTTVASRLNSEQKEKDK